MRMHCLLACIFHVHVFFTRLDLDVQVEAVYDHDEQTAARKNTHEASTEHTLHNCMKSHYIHISSYIIILSRYYMFTWGDFQYASNTFTGTRSTGAYILTMSASSQHVLRPHSVQCPGELGFHSSVGKP